MLEPSSICFVCEKPVLTKDISYHSKVNLPVCNACCGSELEAVRAEELLEGLAEGFVCGCI
jgi:hypothetical protein